jgi:hypothetical protein
MTNKLLDTIWIMRTKDGFYPIQPSEKCKPEDHGRLNDHVQKIEDVNGIVLWERTVQ